MRVDLGVLDAEPEAGDPDAVDSLVAGFVARAQRFEERAAQSRAAGQALVGACTGEWVEALVERTDRLSLGWSHAAGGCAQVAQALAGYAAALRVLGRRASACRHEVGTARMRALAARDRYESAALAGGGAGVGWAWTDVPTFPVAPSAARDLADWRAAVDDVANGVRAFEDCCRERRDLDRATADALAGVDVMTAYAPGAVEGVTLDVPLVQALAAASAGTSSADQRTHLADWFVDVVADLTLDPGDEHARAVLDGLLDAWGRDDQVMSALVLGVGGGRLVGLLTALGQDMLAGAAARNTATAATGARLRTAVSVASSSWSTDRASVFAQELVSAASSRDGALSVIGYLFADPGGARMGEALTVAVADLLDAVERGHGAPWREGPGTPGHALQTAGALTGGADAAHDAAARVLQTLGTYPQAARDWLTGTGIDWSDQGVGMDTGRIEYWFGTREWAEHASDGFAGVGALWAGVQVPPGSGDLQRQVAAINAVVFQSLVGNDSLVPGQLTPPGAQRLAEAIGAQLPGLVEIGMTREPSSSGRGGSLVAAATVPYLESPIVTGSVTRDAVARVLQAATSEAAGRGSVQQAALAYQEQVLGGVAGGLASPSAALDDLVTVWGAVDGASVSAAEVERYLRDQNTRAALDAAHTGVDVGLAISPLKPAASIGVDQLLGHLHGLAEDRLTGGALPSDATRSLVPDSVGSLDDFFVHVVEEYRRIGLWDRAGGHLGDASSEPAVDIAGELVGDYQEIVDAMRARAVDHVKERE